MRALLKNHRVVMKGGRAVLNTPECDCCGGRGPCAKCCLPTGPDPVNGFCSDLCYSDGPRLYLDFSTTGAGFGPLSFSHVPLGVGRVVGAAIGDQVPDNCWSVVLTRNPIRDDGPYFIGGNPYEDVVGEPLDISLYDCATERSTLTALCGDPGGDCIFGMSFLIVCEPDGEGAWTNRYRILWDYHEANNCFYDYSGWNPSLAFDYSLNVNKCWTRDGKVDITFVMHRPPSLPAGCVHYTCPNSTFMFRVYSVP